MQDYEQTVFVSYAWGGEREEIVNQIDKALEERGIKITRDKRDLGYKGSIKEFMERIGHGNCVIVVVSDKYLRSPNCMFELVEIAENKQFHDRIFPIVLADADIYDPVKRLGYVKHWEAKRAELAAAMKDVDPANLQGIREDMDLYDRIRDKISGLASILKDMNSLTPEMHQDSNFSVLYNALEKRMKESHKQEAEMAKDAKPTESGRNKGDNVSATNGSIGVGKIDIGGDVSGNIVIGNNNQINSNKKK
ncbi:MAG: toll/interleukin-1 receptor domain-containing protein [Anaerolineae bacterium]|nr:toll/interleukin-1 receptor domain-containing protein [Anaerolineae bacterium]MCI0608411.1 toll/interleukin-1 receptor domain-containing protein [Anaerolineae bacterium]